MRIKDLQPISAAIARHDASAAIAAIETALASETGSHWNRELRKLVDVIRTDMPRFTVFAKGNSKLPFLAWSSLPGVGFCTNEQDASAKRALYLDNVGRPVDDMTRQQPSRRIERPSLLLRGEHVTLAGDTVTSEPAYIEEL